MPQFACRTLSCLLLLALLPTLPPARAQSAPDTGRATIVTAWDDFYFYLGATVRDPHVNGTNTTPTSQPQQDDDIEVFWDTTHSKDKQRGPHSFQMAVSAASGAYFSVGDGSPIPKAKAVFTYKYAVTVDGTLNGNRDTDTGYTIELAVPWQELGLTGPPKAGTQWGFNVISRDRDDTTSPASRLFSLSPKVMGASDVQAPARWTTLVFSGGSGSSVAGRVVCPHVAQGRYPLINGTIASGEWNTAAQFALANPPVDAPAPTFAEEPNTNDSPFAETAQAPPVPNGGDPGNAPPATATSPPSAQAAPEDGGTGPTAPDVGTGGDANAPIGSIDLPGGGSIKVVPGGIKPPPMVPGVGDSTSIAAAVPKPKKQKRGRREKIAQLPPADSTAGPFLPGQSPSPLTPTQKAEGKALPPPPVALTGSLRLGPDMPPSLVMAVYRMDFNADPRRAPIQNVWNAQGGTLLADQPMDGAGPWFSCLRPAWHKAQLADMRRAGVDVALLRARVDDPLLSRELDALVQALKEMKAAGQDYPLVSVDAAATASVAREVVLAHIPAEFRATIPEGALTQATVISPGRQDSALVGRKDGQTYQSAWEDAINAKVRYVVIDSWDDYMHGTEITATRQYGEKYADDTRIATVSFHGGREWHALYLADTVPHTLKPRALYQVTVRVQNAGTLPWRAGEGYSLCPRWYKDGRLFDDSAPRIPLGTDVFPGQTVTLSVGVAAQNGYGDDLGPGDYTLVLDMVQGQDRWFSYAGDAPLQVPVTLVPAAQTVPRTATFLGTDTPTTMGTGQAYTAHVSVRNDGGQTWTAEKLAYKVQSVGTDGDLSLVGQGMASLGGPIVTGQVANVAVPVPVNGTNGSPLPTGEYRLHWFVQAPDGTDAPDGVYDESLRIVENDPGASFVLSDVPRTVEAGKDETGKLAVGNLGPSLWKKGSHRVGYHWYFLDGALLQWDGGKMTGFTKDVAPGRADGDITAKFHAPNTPGRYALVWDVQDGNGVWASTVAAKGDDILPMLITVTGKDVLAIDLTKYASAVGIGGGATEGSGFDGDGHFLPAEYLPPDGTAELNANPLLVGPAGAPLYPSGYYSAQAGDGDASNHRISFLYPQSNGMPNVVTCKGQIITLSGGYKTLHLLMAAGDDAPISADFGMGNGTQSVTVRPWTVDPTGPNVTLGLRAPVRNGRTGPEATACYLGDYSLPISGKNLTLPNMPNIKIVAVSMEK